MSTALYNLLESKYQKYNNISFIETDPISIPHNFSKKEDIEISAFLSSTIAWGQRKTIINNAKKLIKFMDNSPYDFIINSEESDLKIFKTFVHRTINGDDCLFFIKSLINIYKNHSGLEKCFIQNNIFDAICNFRKIFFEIEHPIKSTRHISNPLMNSASKRINMFLRWMVRNDNIDFGIWKQINTNQLYCPLDVHSGNVSRKLGLLNRKANDWKATVELTESLKKLDKNDPIKYDIALFSLGIFEKF